MTTKMSNDMNIVSTDGLDERVKKINKATNNHSLYKRGNDLILDKKVSDDLEKLGTMILKSKDVESNRQLEKPFWVDEREFGNYAESKRVILESQLATDDMENTMDYVQLNNMNPNQNGNRVNVDMEDEHYKRIEMQKQVMRKDSYKESILRKIEKVPMHKMTKRMKYIKNNIDDYINKEIVALEREQSEIHKNTHSNIHMRTVENGYKDEINVFDSIDIYSDKHVKELLLNVKYADEKGSKLERVLFIMKSEMLLRCDLNARQSDILIHLSNGESYAEISKRLDITKTTVFKTVNRLVDIIIKKLVLEKAIKYL